MTAEGLPVYLAMRNVQQEPVRKQSGYRAHNIMSIERLVSLQPRSQDCLARFHFSARAPPYDNRYAEEVETTWTSRVCRRPASLAEHIRGLELCIVIEGDFDSSERDSEHSIGSAYLLLNPIPWF